MPNRETLNNVIQRLQACRDDPSQVGDNASIPKELMTEAINALRGDTCPECHGAQGKMVEYADGQADWVVCKSCAPRSNDPHYAVSFPYTNWRGSFSERHVVPLRLRLRQDEHHKEPEWVLEGFDLFKKDRRYFALRSIGLRLPDGLHYDTRNLVIRFAVALGEKLYDAQVKHGYSNEWMYQGWAPKCRQRVLDTIVKGDPRDVAAYCAFLWHHREPTFIKDE